MIELDVRDEWVGKTLLELNLRQKYSINIVAICQGTEVCTMIEPQMVLHTSMKLIVIANTEKLSKLM